MIEIRVGSLIPWGEVAYIGLPTIELAFETSVEIDGLLIVKKIERE